MDLLLGIVYCHKSLRKTVFSFQIFSFKLTHLTYSKQNLISLHAHVCEHVLGFLLGFYLRISHQKRNFKCNSYFKWVSVGKTACRGEAVREVIVTLVWDSEACSVDFVGNGIKAFDRYSCLQPSFLSLLEVVNLIAQSPGQGTGRQKRKHSWQWRFSLVIKLWVGVILMKNYFSNNKVFYTAGWYQTDSSLHTETCTQLRTI